MGKEEKPKKKTKPKKKEKSPPIVEFRPQRVTEDPLKAFEERMKQQEEEDNKRVKAKMQEKIQNEEAKVDKLRLEMRKKMKDFKIEKPKPFVPMEPVKKSSKLREMEKSIQKGTFLEDERTKQILDQVRSASRFSKYNKAFVSFEEFDSYTLSNVGTRSRVQ